MLRTGTYIFIRWKLKVFSINLNNNSMVIAHVYPCIGSRIKARQMQEKLNLQ